MEDDPHEVTGRWLRHVLALRQGRAQVLGVRAAPRELHDFAEELAWVRRQLETSNSVNALLMFERLVVRWQSLAA
jgi:hypothetical protein